MQKDIPVFKAQGLIKRFGRLTALNGIDLEVHRGDFVALFGANGAGKTTFLKIASMLMSLSEGELFFNGKPIKDSDDKARNMIGFIAHSTFHYNNLTARENLRFYGGMYDIQDIEEKITKQLESVGLLHRADDLAGGFSRGMLQRLSIARAFLHDPSILLLDEPYTGLDKSASEMLNGLLSSYNTADRAGIMTTHNLDQGYDIATHVGILHKGKIQYFARTSDISKEEFSNKYSEIVG